MEEKKNDNFILSFSAEDMNRVLEMLGEIPTKYGLAVYLKVQEIIEEKRNKWAALQEEQK